MAGVLGKLKAATLNASITQTGTAKQIRCSLLAISEAKLEFIEQISGRPRRWNSLELGHDSERGEGRRRHRLFQLDPTLGALGLVGWRTQLSLTIAS